MILVQLLLTAFVLQNIGHCYLPADINQTLRKIQKEIEILKQEQSFLYEYCQLKPRDICGPCVCRDDDRLSKKYYCDCRNLQTKRDCLEYKQNGIKINGAYKVHQNLLKIIQVYCDQTLMVVVGQCFKGELMAASVSFETGKITRMVSVNY